MASALSLSHLNRNCFRQMILYDTPGVMEKEMHKLDSMMMKNVHNAAVNADCVLVLVDACKAPEKVCFFDVELFVNLASFS